MEISLYKDHNESLGFLFWQINSIWKKKINETLSPYNITHTQFVILAAIYYLDSLDNEIIQKDISEFTNIDKMTLSNSIRLMEEKHLLERVDFKKDFRAKSLKLKEKGREVIKESLPLVENVDNQLFGELTLEERDELLRILNKPSK